MQCSLLLLSTDKVIIAFFQNNAFQNDLVLLHLCAVVIIKMAFLFSRTIEVGSNECM